MSVKARKLASGKTVYDVQTYIEVRDARGKRKKITRTFATRQEAIRAEARLKVEAEGGGARDSKRTVGDLLDAYLEHKSGLVAATTLYGYKLVADREIRPKLGSVKLDRLTTRHIDGLYADLRKRGLSGRSIHNVETVFSGALGQAVRWQWIPANPADNASPGPLGGREGRVATLAEVEALLAAASPEMALAIRLAAVTGARRSELCGLQWGDIDWDKSTVRIERARVDTGGRTSMKTTKTGIVRTIPLDAGTLALLKEHRGIAGPIVRWSPRALSQHLTDLCDEVGIEGLGWHGFRHLAATLLIASGTDARTVADRLGHANPAITLRTYSHVLADRAVAAADILGQAIGAERSAGTSQGSV